MHVDDLKEGMKVRFLTTFKDFDGKTVSAGKVRVFVGLNYFVHDGGYTLTFDDGTVIRLAEIDPKTDPIINDRENKYWEIID